MLEHLDSWSKFTLKPTVVGSHYLSNFGFSNEEINPKNGIYAKNWARQVLLENFDFWVNICAKVNFWKLDICTISELRMKKRVPKSECTRKIKWDRSVLKILTFWSRSRSRVHLVKAFSLYPFFFYLNFFFFSLQAVRTRSGFQAGLG